MGSFLWNSIDFFCLIMLKLTKYRTILEWENIMGLTNSITNRNQTLDILKFIASFAVVCIHYMFSGTAGDVVRAISRFAVPFFFAVSGFFAYYDDAGKTQRKIKHILIIYVSSFILYFFYSAFKHIFAGGDLLQYVLRYIKTITIVDFLVLNTTISSVHIWFLPSLIYCYLLHLLLNKRVPERILFIIAFLFMFVYLTAEEVLPVFKIEISKYLYANVLLRAYPCFVLGMFVRKYKTVIKERVTRPVILLILVLGIIETIVSVMLWGNSITYFGSMLIATSFLLIAISHEEKKYCDFLVKISSFNLYIYVCHIAIGGTIQTILDYVGLGEKILWINSKPVIVFVLSIILSYLIDYVIKNIFKRKAIS